MTTEQEVLDDLIQAITNTNTSNDDFLKVLKEGRDQDVALRDGTVVPSLTKRVVNAFSNSDYLMKADNLASVVDKQEARDNLNVPTKEDVAQATETEKGTAKIATTAIAQAGVNDTDIITALKLQQKINNVSFGINQGLSNPTTLADTWYTNTSGKVMFAHNKQGGRNHSVDITVRVGVTEYIFSSGSVGNNLGASVSVMAIIPIGAEYKCNYANMLIFS